MPDECQPDAASVMIEQACCPSPLRPGSALPCRRDKSRDRMARLLPGSADLDGKGHKTCLLQSSRDIVLPVAVAAVRIKAVIGSVIVRLECERQHPSRSKRARRGYKDPFEPAKINQCVGRCDRIESAVPALQIPGQLVLD